MTVTNQSAAQEIIGHFQPQLRIRLRNLSPSKAAQEIRSWPKASLAVVYVFKLIDVDYSLTELGLDVIDTLIIEFTQFEVVKERLSTEGLAWLVHPDTIIKSTELESQAQQVRALTPIARLELVINDIVDANTSTFTPFGVRFAQYLRAV